MNATLGIRTTMGDKIFTNVFYITVQDGYMTILYRHQGIEKKAIFEMEYITHFALGGR
jgi:hypothetical protein